MPRHILEEQRIHHAIRERVFTVASVVAEVETALTEHPLVVVGMRQNPFPRRARRLLEEKGLAYHYLEYGSYLSQWRTRLALKLWTGWPTFPMVFVRGTLIGGFEELQRLLSSSELQALLSADPPGLAARSAN
ncbi:MAG: glutaredoxin [Deltaproteobacteria bacterium]